MFLSKVLVLLLSFTVCYVSAETIEVQTDLGTLVGLVEESSFNGKKYHSFKGIPYSKKITEATKFKDSEPAEPWGRLEAFDFGSGCLCYDLMIQMQVGNINCLYMNVYVPADAPSYPVPVMLFIHGGAFIFGSGDDMLYGGDFLFTQDVAVVTINYRLGPFGFLNVGTEDAPGNMGLKDQLRAIKFFKEHLAGPMNCDPEKITIFGESAGSASVAFQILSPLSAGTFSQAIQESGSCLDSWAFSDDRNDALAITREMLGISIEDPVELAKELTNNWTGEQIIDKYEEFISDGRNQIEALIYAPTVEDEIPGVERFLSDTPKNLMMGGKLTYKGTLLLGVNSDEGALFAGEVAKFFEALESKDPSQFNALIPESVAENLIDPENFVCHIFEFYTGKCELGGTEAQITKLISDLSFFLNFWITINGRYLLDLKTYAYYFAVRTQGGLLKDYLNIQENTCIHAEELMYLFRMDITDNDYDEDTFEHLTMKRLTTYWANYAKYGTPSPDGSDLPTWRPYNDGKDVMVINEDLNMVHVTDIENDFHKRMCHLVSLLKPDIQEYLSKFELC